MEGFKASFKASLHSLVLFLGILLWPLTLLLVFLPWEPDVSFGFPEAAPLREGQKEEEEQESCGPVVQRFTETFEVPCSAAGSSQCEAWLYLPRRLSSSAAPPVIIMASGMGMSRDVGLPVFARTFAENGYAVLLFDYLFWGGSNGRPRQLIAPRLHVLDYVAAVKHVQATNGLAGRVDPLRIVLWGTSYSGGHALAAASQLGQQISAVIAMESFTSPLLIALAFFYVHFCPYSKGVPVEDVVPGAATVTAHMSVEATTGSYKASNASNKGQGLNDAIPMGGKSKIGCPAAYRVHGALDFLQFLLWESLAAIATVVRALRLLLVGMSDVIRGSLGLPAAYVAIVAPASAVAARLQEPWGVLRTPLSLGILTNNDYAQMMAAVPKPPLGKWQNLAAARMLFSYPFYRPLKGAAGLTCPILMVAGRHDLLTPEHSIRKAARILARTVGEQNVSVVALDGTHISLYKSPMLLPTMMDFLALRVPLGV